MEKDEFLAIKTAIDLNYEALSNKIGKGVSTTQGYGSGTPIPESVAIIMRFLKSQLPKKIKESTLVDVSEYDKISIAEIANICLDKQHRKEFLGLPAVDALIKLKVLEEKLNEKENKLLENIKKQSF